ncbi:glucosyl transferase [Candidatus Gracilibacteria bacterium]|nr:glucosyl transferase [Candidatus Gracilibacteria bacterium]NJM89448.1 glucosyl transferase [Hydrococcus sp. RU_2_2]NJP21662.1 glucosyl transferase [Hydrococcus sp. CRU_1_1]
MILVTVGTEKFPFNRLMQWVDLLQKEGFISAEEEVIVQYGSCTVVSDKVKGYSLLPVNEFQNLLKQARLVIAHCGEGTIDVLAKNSVPFILVPRSDRFNEHVDDHQIELAEVLAEQGIPIAYCPGDLARFVVAPEAIRVSKVPADSYAYASSLLDKRFGSTPVAEEPAILAPSPLGWQNYLFGFWQKLTVKLPILSN